MELQKTTVALKWCIARIKTWSNPKSIPSGWLGLSFLRSKPNLIQPFIEWGLDYSIILKKYGEGAKCFSKFLR